MGCDIHFHQEVKINGTWHHYRELSIERNYRLFALMAGVRNYGKVEPVAEAKGLPEDITFLTRYSYERWKDDYHHATWLDAEEIKEIIQKYFKENIWDAEDTFDYLFGNSWRGFTDYPSDQPEGLENIRWVFWFDN